MRDLLISVSKLSIPTGINILSSLIRNKILALLVGPMGLGVYSQIVNLCGFVYSVLPVGSLGLVRYISNYYEINKIDEISYILKYFFKKNLIFSIILSISIIFFRNSLSKWIFSDSEFSNLLVLFSIFIPLNLLLNLIDIFLKSTRHINTYVLFLSINSLISIIFSIPLIYFFALEGAVLALVLTVLLSLISSLILLKKRELFLNFQKTIKVDDVVIKNIYKFGIAGLVSLGVQNIMFLAIKSLIAQKLGLSGVGIFQCVYSLSAGYFGIFFVLMGSYGIPKVSSFNSINEIIIELNSLIKFLLLVYIPVIILMFIGRSSIISLLYSNEFKDAKYLLIFQLPAELVRAFSWVMGLWLIAKLKTKQWVMFELIFYSSFFLFFYTLLQYFNIGIKSVSISYLIAYILFFLINYFYCFRKIKFKFSTYNFRLLFVSLLFLLLAFMISYFDEIIGLYVLIPIELGWLILVIRKEDIVQLKEIWKLNNK